jgi:hypothetical protein
VLPRIEHGSVSYQVVVLPNKPSKREISFETGIKRFYKIVRAKINIVNAPPLPPLQIPGFQNTRI